MLTPLLRFVDDVPPHMWGVPGVRQNKRRPGFRVPINALPLMGENVPRVDGGKMLERVLTQPHVHPWVGGFLMDHQRAILQASLPKSGFSGWAPPGSGKTLVGILWASADSGTKLVITKAAARGTWREEIRKYTKFEPVVLKGQTPEVVTPKKECNYITAWETLLFWKEAFLKMGVSTLVMDEIHWAKQHKRVKPIVLPNGKTKWEDLPNTAAAASRLAQNVKRRLGLTATPIPNRPRDLWAQLDLVEPWQWGSYHDFGVRHCGGFKDTYGWKYDGLTNTDELQERLQWSKHKTSQRSISACLPDKRRQVVYLDLDEQNAPSGFKNDIQRASKTNDRESMFEVMLQEAASRKRKYVVDRVLEALACKQKVVVFTGRRKDCERLGAELEKKVPVGIPVWCAHGGTPAETRDVIRHEYMESEVGILVGTGDAWGESVNLQDTDLALFVMLPWTPRSIGQWEGRFARLGQKRPVLISYIIASGTVDEHVSELLLDKLPAVGVIAEDEVIQEVEGAFSSDGRELLSRVVDKLAANNA